MTHPLGPAAAVTAAGARAADVLNEALRAGLVGCWVAIRLSDGGSDGHVYELRADAVRYQLNELQCMYLAVPPMMTSPVEAQRLIDMHRDMYDAGLRMTDPQTEGQRRL